MELERPMISTLMPDQFAKLEGFLGNRFKLLNFSMISTQNIEPDENQKKIILNLHKFDWLIFTSMRGVAGFYHFLQKSKIKIEELKNLKTAAIGQSTAIEIKSIGLSPDYINQGNTSEEFAILLLNNVLQPNQNILLIQGERADNKFEETLNKYCHSERINVYKTIDTENFDESLKQLIDKNNYELIIFTSPSGFENFVRLGNYKPDKIQFRIASIGMKTTKAIENMGFKVMITAERSDLEGLAEVIKKDFII